MPRTTTGGPGLSTGLAQHPHLDDDQGDPGEAQLALFQGVDTNVPAVQFCQPAEEFLLALGQHPLEVIDVLRREAKCVEQGQDATQACRRDVVAKEVAPGGAGAITAWVKRPTKDSSALGGETSINHRNGSRR